MAVQIQTVVVAQPERRRFTVDEYERMAEDGILGEDERIELIEGEIVAMAAMNARHAGCVAALTDLLPPRLGTAAQVRVQLPVAIPPRDVPEPDVAVVRARGDHYRRKHPGPGDVLLLIEVADTSLAYDRAVKLPIYARAGIPEVWLADLAGHGIERHAEPDLVSRVYRSMVRFGRGQTVAALMVPELSLSVDDVLG